MGLYCTVVICRLTISLTHVEKFDVGHLMQHIFSGYSEKYAGISVQAMSSRLLNEVA